MISVCRACSHIKHCLLTIDLKGCVEHELGYVEGLKRSCSYFCEEGYAGEYTMLLLTFYCPWVTAFIKLTIFSKASNEVSRTCHHLALVFWIKFPWNKSRKQSATDAHFILYLLYLWWCMWSLWAQYGGIKWQGHNRRTAGMQQVELWPQSDCKPDCIMSIYQVFTTPVWLGTSVVTIILQLDC